MRLQDRLMFNINSRTEAEKQEQINKAAGEAQAMLAVAEARSRGLKLIAHALADRVCISQINSEIYICLLLYSFRKPYGV